MGSLKKRERNETGGGEKCVECLEVVSYQGCIGVKMCCSLRASWRVFGLADVINPDKSSSQCASAAAEIGSGHQHGAVSQD